MPAMYFKRRFDALKKFEAECEQLQIQQRLDYYFKISSSFQIPRQAVAVKDFKRSKGTGYYFDLKAFLHYFKSNTRFAYKFGDDTDVYDYPCLFKARPIVGDNANSILFKLNKRRHFKWVNDSRSFSEKKNQMVWRGAAYKPLRRNFIQKFWNHPLVDAGQTNKPAEDVPWQKPPMSIADQLKYKFIFCPEGNDVATNLKWAMSSNSLCIMPKPKYETWFMEGVLQDGVHYVEVKSDFSNLAEKIEFYISNPEKAEAIIQNAHTHVRLFQNKNLEDLLCLKVLERYAQMSGQKNALKY